jgi:hypothetical protein
VIVHTTEVRVNETHMRGMTRKALAMRPNEGVFRELMVPFTSTTT